VHYPSPPEQIVLEAMKMEYAVLAPRDGTVADIAVAQGDMVSRAGRARLPPGAMHSRLLERLKKGWYWAGCTTLSR